MAKPDESIDLRQIAITAEPAPTATSEFDLLGGTRWRVRSYRDPASHGSLSPVLTGTTLTVDFGLDGKVPGSAGCNTYSATHVVNGSQPTIALPTATPRICAEPAGTMEQETAFLALLPTIGSYSIAGGQLTLNSASGQIVAELVAY